MTDRTGITRLTPLISEAASVEGEADLGRVLRTLVAEVMTATGAPYAAMGVIGEHQVLSDFVYEGISKEHADRIGHLPTGEGVLGTVIRENQTIILERISDHPDSVGFPASNCAATRSTATPSSAASTPKIRSATSCRTPAASSATRPRPASASASTPASRRAAPSRSTTTP